MQLSVQFCKVYELYMTPARKPAIDMSTHTYESVRTDHLAHDDMEVSGQVAHAHTGMSLWRNNWSCCSLSLPISTLVTKSEARAECISILSSIAA